MDNNKLGGKSIILRLEMNTHEVHFGQVASSIFEAGGDIVAIDVIQTSQNMSVRDITITVTDTVDIGIITEMIKGLAVSGWSISRIEPLCCIWGEKSKPSLNRQFRTVMIYLVCIHPM